MKKYLAFAKTVIRENAKEYITNITTIISFVIHILVFSALWEYVLEGKALVGYTKQDLIWYVIFAEAILYSFYNYYKKIAFKVEMGDFAYDMTKPYNFLARIISEGIAELPITIVICIVGIILGFILAGPINISLLSLLLVLLVALMAACVLLELQVIVGLSSIWLGRDVSSFWLLIQKAMLIFAFTPLELFPKAIQIPLLCLPTTHVIYTPSKLLVHFSTSLFFKSIAFEAAAILLLTVILIIIYKKGVKKQNVNGI